MRAPSMQALTNDYRKQYPGVIVFGVGDEAHKLRVSDHNEDDTPGSLAAQSDSDNVPEHRAIDVMLGPVFDRFMALYSISVILLSYRNRQRLRYINFENTQWHMINDFMPHDNSTDPHPDHIHFSGRASTDPDSAPWFGVDMTYEQADRNTATADTWRLLALLQNLPAAQYQLPGEREPRMEKNELKLVLETIQATLGQLVQLEHPITLSDEQLEELASRVAHKLRGITFMAAAQTWP